MYNNNKIKIVFSIIILAFSVNANAQTIPTSAQPGVIMRNLEQRDRAPSSLGDITTVSEDQASGKELSDKKMFTLNEVILEGSTIYSELEINVVVKDYIGKEVSFRDLNVISGLLTKRYRDDGYLFSKVILPPQKIKDGVVRFKAAEGRISDVKVTGEFKDKNGLVADFVEKIKAAGPSNTKTIERYLLLIDDLPGITARSFLQASPTVPGGVDMVLNIEQDDFEGSATVDNRGSKYVGPYRGTVVGAFNSLLGMHDRTTLRAINTFNDELLFGDITHEQQVGKEGTRIKVRYGVTETEPGADIAYLNPEGDSETYDIEALHPYIRNRQHNVNFITGFNAQNSSSDLLGVLVSEDKVRSVRAGVRGDFTDALAGVNELEFLVTQGVDVFGATEDGVGRTRANGKHEFTKANANLTRIQGLGGRFSAQFSVAGQLSADPLLVSEEFSLGGEAFGRAYDSGELTGDSGLAGLVELRFGDVMENKYINSYQLYTFYDAGKVWNKNPVVSESSNASLSSTGVGVRFNLANEFSTDLQLSKPLIRDVAAIGDDDYRVFFNLTKRF